MAPTAFNSPQHLLRLNSARHPTSQQSKASRSRVVVMSRNNKKNKGFFNSLKDSILRPIVSVPGSGRENQQLLECVFCKGTGSCDCDACKGSGKDALGTCLMCDGKTYLQCTVCMGVGTVDRIRRGGTDDKNDFVVKK